MKRNGQKIGRVLGVAGLLAVFCGGCGIILYPQRLLEGNWYLETLEAGNLPTTAFTISPEGRLTSVDFTIDGVKVSPAILDSSVKLQGKTASISAIFNSGSLTFTGTLDSLDKDEMMAIGTVSAEVQIGSLHLSLKNAPAKIGKLE
jgi:hypothetical protein